MGYHFSKNHKSIHGPLGLKFHPLFDQHPSVRSRYPAHAAASSCLANLSIDLEENFQETLGFILEYPLLM